MAAEYTLGDVHAGEGKAGEHIRTTARPEREADYAAPKSIITLSRIDEGDMYRLGRQQELNVRKPWIIPIPISKDWMVLAQLSIHLYSGFLGRFDGNMGGSTYVSF